MSAAMTRAPEAASPPGPALPSHHGGGDASTGGTAVFHVERLPLGGWGVESPPGRRGAAGMDHLARAVAGGPARRTGTARSIHSPRGVDPARAALAGGQPAERGGREEVTGATGQAEAPRSQDDARRSQAKAGRSNERTGGAGRAEAPRSQDDLRRSPAEVGRPNEETGAAASRWRGVFAWPFLAVLWLYRRLVSPVLPPACRYYPSCSQYAVEAVTLHGPLRGLWLSARRLLRCHPWAPGGPDPVPPRHRPDPGRVP